MMEIFHFVSEEKKAYLKKYGTAIQLRGHKNLQVLQVISRLLKCFAVNVVQPCLFVLESET